MSLRQNAFVLLLLAALTAIVGDWLQADDLARMWRVPAVLLFAGLAYEVLLVGRARLELRIRSRELWYLGRRTEVALELAQALPRALGVEIAPQPPDGVDCSRAVLSVAVGPAPARIPLSAVARRLGSHAWPPQRVRVAGPLGLAWWPRRLAAAATLRVMPDGGAQARPALTQLRGGARAARQAGAGAEVLQLREFRPGDALRAIDWKATARRGALVSRDFAEDQHLDIIVAIDAGRSSGIWCGDLDRLGHYVNLSLRFAAHAVANDDRVGIVVYGDRALAALPPARGQAALRQLRELLGAVRVQPADSNPLNAAARIRTLVRHRSLVLLLTDVGDAASAGQLAQAVQLLALQHLPAVVGLRSAARTAFARAAGGGWLDPYRALAAEEDRLREQRRIAAFAVRGVLALASSPERLERDVFAAYERVRRRRRV